jgi:N-acetylneuraminate synthase
MTEVRTELDIQGRQIGEKHPTYFIADIAANHDGDLERAKELIHLAAEAGADAAKFQHFKAETIVSDHGFRSLGRQWSHQASWKKSVFEVYTDASVDLRWTEELAKSCREAGIAFLTSPYAFDLVDHVDPYVPAYKIGSGDITWLEIIRYIAAKQKPVFLACGASSMDDVARAIDASLSVNPRLGLLQCNTNYTGSLDNFRFIQLNVLRSFRAMYPEMVLGLSDHTPGHATVLCAIALGARIIEKHFTDDVKRTGPDHAFSMDPRTWRDMIHRARELESALGTGLKRVEANECDTVVLQRRSIRLKRDLQAGHVLSREDVEMLRPCPVDALPPYAVDDVVGKALRDNLKKDAYLKVKDLA